MNLPIGLRRIVHLSPDRSCSSTPRSTAYRPTHAAATPSRASRSAPVAHASHSPLALQAHDQSARAGDLRTLKALKRPSDAGFLRPVDAQCPQPCTQGEIAQHVTVSVQENDPFIMGHLLWPDIRGGASREALKICPSTATRPEVSGETE